MTLNRNPLVFLMKRQSIENKEKFLEILIDTQEEIARKSVLNCELKFNFVQWPSAFLLCAYKPFSETNKRDEQWNWVFLKFKYIIESAREKKTIKKKKFTILWWRSFFISCKQILWSEKWYFNFVCKWLLQLIDGISHFTFHSSSNQKKLKR